MAARRLIAVMLVLLFLSSLAAALAPVERQQDTTTTTELEPATEPEAERGELVRETIAADAKRPPTVRAKVGDQLQLRVKVRRPATLELVRLGPTADADPLAPARFDVLLGDDGEFPIRDLETDKRVGLIVVSRRRLAPKAPDAGRAGGRS